jgi:hypothetical protein
VRLADVQDWLVTTGREYHVDTVVFDPRDAMGIAQELKGIFKMRQYDFTQQSAAQLGSTLLILIRNGELELPDDDALIDELAHVRLRETGPNQYRLDHCAGRHDDRAIAIALAAVHLLEHPDWEGPRIRVLG